MDPMERAKLGDLEFFKEAAVDVILTASDDDGVSVLDIAAGRGDLECCKIIIQRCPQLLYRTMNTGANVLHAAAALGQPDSVKFLLRVGIETRVTQDGNGIAQDIETGDNAIDRMLLMMADNYNQSALHYAIRYGTNEYGKLQCAKVLLEADPTNSLLRMVDNGNDTAMHVAVANHKLEFVKLFLETDSAFVYAPNKSGQTPHLTALQESLSGDITAVAIRNILIEKQPEECKKQVGEKGWTLLHHATFNGDITAIDEILEFSPDCAKVVDNEGQNFIHLAAKLEHEKVLRHIMGSTKVNEYVLNQQDIHGNTPFHIATLQGNANMGTLMLYDPRVDKFATNKQGKTALAAINFDYDKRRAGVYGFMDRVDEKDIKDRGDFDLLVGALISTVSFTVGITVPGGYFSDGPHQGNAVLYKKASFEVFVVSNTIALALSLYAVFSHFCTKHLINAEDIVYQLKVATFCSLCSIFAMMIAFITGSYAVLAVSTRLAIIVCVICCCFFVFSIRAMWQMMRKGRPRRTTSM